MRADLFEQNPRTSGLTPVSGATDFSMDEGRLMRMGDIRIIVRDHHTRRIVFPFRKPQTTLLDGGTSINLDDYPYDHSLSTNLGFSLVSRGSFPLNEFSETFDIKAQMVDGFDRRYGMLSVVYPALFASNTHDLDYPGWRVDRRCVQDGTTPAQYTLEEDEYRYRYEQNPDAFSYSLGDPHPLIAGQRSVFQCTWSVPFAGKLQDFPNGRVWITQLEPDNPQDVEVSELYTPQSITPPTFDLPSTGYEFLTPCIHAWLDFGINSIPATSDPAYQALRWFGATGGTELISFRDAVEVYASGGETLATEVDGFIISKKPVRSLLVTASRTLRRERMRNWREYYDEATNPAATAQARTRAALFSAYPFDLAYPRLDSACTFIYDVDLAYPEDGAEYVLGRYVASGITVSTFPQTAAMLSSFIAAGLPFEGECYYGYTDYVARSVYMMGMDHRIFGLGPPADVIVLTAPEQAIAYQLGTATVSFDTILAAWIAAGSP